jgi:quercetin dioxygenase-like cupin family protein
MSDVAAGASTKPYGHPRSPGEPPPPLAPGRPPEDGHVDCKRYPGVTVGEGYAVGSLADLGGEHGFRKVRPALGVTAFGVNALVRPPGYETKWHRHESQQELYFVHQGAIELQLGDGSSHRLDPGSFARVDATTVRRIRILGPGETVYLCMGGKDGYIGLDGIAADAPR